MNNNKMDVVRLVKTARGQIEGMMSMIGDGKYCIDISNQIMASIAILQKANFKILDNHIHSCALNATDDDKKTKMDEIPNVLRKVLK